MYVRPESVDEEIRVTVDAAMDITNAIADEPADIDDLGATLRAVLVRHEFVRAERADDGEFEALADRCVSIARLVEGLPGAALPDAVARVNAELESCAIAPSLSAHDGFALHIHWTSASTPFAHQVAVDLLMALAQTLCDHGTQRFGRCAADGCRRVFFDVTKNRSRRFCSDSRCASRTHTAAHRARQAAGR